MTIDAQLKYKWWVEWITPKGNLGHTPAFGLEDGKKLAKEIRAEGMQCVRVCKKLREDPQ